MIQWDAKKARTAAMITNAVITKALLIAGGYYLGNALDSRFGTTPYLMISGITLGLSLGLWWLVMTLNKLKF